MTAQELIEMTPEQQRAFNRIRKAVKDFKASGGRFHTVLETMYGLNGKYIFDIYPDGIEGDVTRSSIIPTSEIFDFGFSGFADDEHNIKLTDEGLALLGQDE